MRPSIIHFFGILPSRVRHEIIPLAEIHHPLSAKLGVPQKISYLLIPILIVLMFITGICLWVPTMNWPF